MLITMVMYLIQFNHTFISARWISLSLYKNCEFLIARSLADVIGVYCFHQNMMIRS